ncbi:S1C family serine protease [Polyangium mundeleinium]|uniref:Serine protease n=1 Tax=Polyangium mundeleinium TaxID=2995306 RepID=A0ABT5EZA0_9BACT|nr:serine protease [Polyangium mundeleinium]MDC0746493.1 serine protease [Polyangium mundeleinium]
MASRLAFGLVLFLMGCGGSTPLPETKEPAASAAKANVPEMQRKATVRVKAELPEDVKTAFVETVKKSHLPDAMGTAGVGWTSTGSGFFLKSPDGKGLVLITNRHVVDSAPKVTIVLDEHTSLSDCEVLYTDDKYDVAVVKVPESLATSAIAVATLADASVKNDEAVQASGYPRVGDQQSYRLTSGTISNADFSVTVRGHKSSFLQHTAAIDPGNSGGPLFRKDSLEVIGINTLTMRSNDNLYSAVPAATVKGVIERAFKVPAKSDVQATIKQIQGSCKELMDELSIGGEPPISTVALVSDRLVADRGVPTWELRYIENGPPQRNEDTGEIVPGKPKVNEEAFGELVSAVKKGDVMEHLRGLTFAYLYVDLKRQKGVNGDPCSRVVEKDVRDYADRGFVRVGMDLGTGERRTMRFRFEQGHWRLSGYE